MKNKNDFSFLISSFLTNYLTNVRNLSPNTVISYRDSIVFLLSYMNDVCNIKPEKLKISDLSAERIKNFLTWLEEEKCCTIKTRNLRLVAIHSLFRYISLQRPEYMFQAQQILAIPAKKTNKPIVHYLQSAEIEKLLATPDSSSKKGLRDQALLCLMYDSGCRIQSVTPDHTTFTARGKKPGDCKREITLTNTEFIRRYLMHVLPSGFQKVRYYGFLNNRMKKKNLKIIFTIQGYQKFRQRFINLSMAELLKTVWHYDIQICSACGHSTMQQLGRSHVPSS